MSVVNCCQAWIIKGWNWKGNWESRELKRQAGFFEISSSLCLWPPLEPGSQVRQWVTLCARPASATVHLFQPPLLLLLLLLLPYLILLPLLLPHLLQTATVPHSGGPSVPVSGCLVWTPSASPTTFQTAKHLARHRSHHKHEIAKYHIMISYFFHTLPASNTRKTFWLPAIKHLWDIQSPTRQEIQESWKPCKGKNGWSSTRWQSSPWSSFSFQTQR